jgi:hypothetical protein
MALFTKQGDAQKMQTKLEPIGKTSDGERVLGFELNPSGEITSVILMEGWGDKVGHYPVATRATGRTIKRKFG